MHIRDPRAVLVSWFYFAEKTMRTAEQAADLDRQAGTRFLVAYPIDTDYFALSRDEKIEALTRSFYQNCIDRITSWLGVADSDSDIECLFLTYEDLLKDEEAYFKRLTDFYGIDKKIMGPPKSTNPHFRQGTVDGWRKELNKGQIRALNERIPDILWQRFGWDPH